MVQKEETRTYAIYFIPVELNYTTIEKEMLEVIHFVNKFRHYITGYEVFVHTDHSTIRYLMNKPITQGRVTIWLLLLQEFNITIIDWPGKENQVADFLSRINTSGQNVPIVDYFLDENLFAISIQSLWFSYIANYVSSWNLPPHFSPIEKRQVIKQSVRYSWITGDLFYTGNDLIIRRCIR